MLYRITVLTILFILIQVQVFFDHYKISNLMDSLVSASIAQQLLQPVILLPLTGYLSLQVLAYVIYISFIWFVARSVSDWLRLGENASHCLAMALLVMGVFSILGLNQYYFPESCFAAFMSAGNYLWLIALALLLMLALFSFIYCFWHKRFRLHGSILLAVFILAFYEKNPAPIIRAQTKPNIIIIGLDSLRPDFTGFYGNNNVHTPNIDNFLGRAIHFSEAYTPLARTFPAWMSILTAKYPRHHQARNNLIDSDRIMQQETIAKVLQKSGYTTIYATDEKRFSNITKEYGFDRILGPRMGVNDFLIGGMSDFPLSNLLVNLPVGRFLFPYNYGNRAAVVTYQPDTFLQTIKRGLVHLENKPVFLAVHLCLAHWPSRWADKGNPASPYISIQYSNSVNALDQQFGALMKLLETSGMLENSWVVILSDHGTGLGLPHDRIISEVNYEGNRKNMSIVPAAKLSALLGAVNKPVYTINTAYGQGTNILSFKQNRVLLAMYHDGVSPREIKDFASLIDIAPTILSALNLPPLSGADGISLMNHAASKRPFFMETGDSLSEIETDQIYIDKVIKRKIGIYRIHGKEGLLVMDKVASESIIKNKQLAVLWDDWLLAHFPASKRNHKIVPPYRVLVNVKTGKWTVEMNSDFAKSAPLAILTQKLREFYGSEFHPVYSI